MADGSHITAGSGPGIGGESIHRYKYVASRTIFALKPDLEFVRCNLAGRCDPLHDDAGSAINEHNSKPIVEFEVVQDELGGSILRHSRSSLQRDRRFRNIPVGLGIKSLQ